MPENVYNKYINVFSQTLFYPKQSHSIQKFKYCFSIVYLMWHKKIYKINVIYICIESITVLISHKHILINFLFHNLNGTHHTQTKRAPFYYKFGIKQPLEHDTTHIASNPMNTTHNPPAVRTNASTIKRTLRRFLQIPLPYRKS